MLFVYVITEDLFTFSRRFLTLKFEKLFRKWCLIFFVSRFPLFLNISNIFRFVELMSVEKYLAKFLTFMAHILMQTIL